MEVLYEKHEMATICEAPKRWHCCRRQTRSPPAFPWMDAGVVGIRNAMAASTGCDDGKGSNGRHVSVGASPIMPANYDRSPLTQELVG